jgi:hypothetical protein
MYLARVQCVHADDDGDGYIPGVDCDDAWDAVWLRPSEVHELRFMDSETLAWGAPEDLGAVPEQIVYDLLRSEQPTDFGPDAVCVEAGDGSDEQAMDPESPPVGQAFFYLVRAQNDCEPGEGTLGAASTGIERSGQSCE